MMSHCVLCNTKPLETFSKRDSKSGKRLRLSLCRGCGMIQQADIPDADELGIYYSHHYRSDYKKTHNPKTKHVWRAGKAALDRISFLLKTLPEQRRPLKLVDIGAGGGEFTYMAKRAGLDARGIEPNIGYSEFARETYDVEVKTGEIRDLETASADIITLFHVLEHLPNPHAAIEKIYESLQAGGLVLIEVPNILALDSSPTNIFFKAHLWYFSPRTLRSLLEPYFEIIAFEDAGNLRIIGKKRTKKCPGQPLGEHAAAADIGQFHQKGWGQYLTRGGGIFKPWRKIERLVAERAIRSHRPRELLDDLFSNWQGAHSHSVKKAQRSIYQARAIGTFCFATVAYEAIC